MEEVQGKFEEPTGFCKGCDHVIKIYDGKLLAVDGTNK